MHPVASCDQLSKALLASFKNPPTIGYPLGPITYGTEVQMNCSVEGGESSARKRTCLFDIDTHSYQLIGDSLECGRESSVAIMFLVIYTYYYISSAS